MEPAAEAWRRLAQVEIACASGAPCGQCEASAVTDPAADTVLLVEQVDGSVRWRESIHILAAEGVTEIWEIGAGKALSGMIRRIDRAIACQARWSPEDIGKRKWLKLSKFWSLGRLDRGEFRRMTCFVWMEKTL